MNQSVRVMSFPLSVPNIDEMKTNRDVKGLMKALEYSELATVRVKAAKALGKVADEFTMNALVAATHDCDEKVRLASLSAISKIRIARVKRLKVKKDVSGLIKILESSQELNILTATVEALGKIGNLQAIDALYALSKVPTDSRLHSATVNQLHNIPPTFLRYVLLVEIEEKRKEQTTNDAVTDMLIKKGLEQGLNLKEATSACNSAKFYGTFSQMCFEFALETVANQRGLSVPEVKKTIQQKNA
jgi:HEAT repeat protein